MGSTNASSSGSIGPSFQWDLLNYGRIINNVRLQESGLEELIASGELPLRSGVLRLVDEAIAANPDKVEAVKAKPSMIGWFVGQVMKATKGQADGKVVNQVLTAKASS